MELDTVVCGDCLDILPTIPSQSVDAVITDPPYPCIKRDYGYWTVEEWWALIVEGVMPEVRRILKVDWQCGIHLATQLRACGQDAWLAVGVHGLGMQGMEHGTGCVVVEYDGITMWRGSTKGERIIKAVYKSLCLGW